MTNKKKSAWGWYTPHKCQKEAHRDQTRFLAIVAGARSGKTYAGAVEFVRRIIRDRKNAKPSERLNYWALAPSYPIQETQRSVLLFVLDKIGALYKANIQKRTLEIFWDGCLPVRVAFRSTWRDDLVAESVNGFWFDEASRAPERSWTRGLSQRVADTRGFGIITTTSLGRNWIYEVFFEKAHRVTHRGRVEKREGGDPEISHHAWYTVDNTMIPALADEVEKQKTRLSEAVFRREYEASYDAYEGMIYSDFNPSVHVISRLNRINEREMPNDEEFEAIDVGIDFGWRPGTMLIIGIMPNGDRYAIDEIYENERDTEYWIMKSKQIVERFKNRFVVFRAPADQPERKSRYRREGLITRDAVQNVADGIAFVQSLLHISEKNGRPRLFISSRCKNLIREITSYRYQENVEKPVKSNDHAVDALRYGVFYLNSVKY